MKLRPAAALAASAIGVASLARPSTCRADTATTIKMTTGAAMLGAELTVIGESAFGVPQGWPYLVGSVLGAGAGGAAGYFLGGNIDNRPASFVLAGGVAMVIPSLVALAAASYYVPPEQLQKDSRSAEGAHLDVPTVAIEGAFSEVQQHQYGVEQATVVRLSFLRGVF